MKSQQTISETSQALTIDEHEQNKREHFKKLGLTISLATFSIGFSIYTGSAKAGIEDMQPYYRYVPYQGPGSATAPGQQQPGKQSSGASGAEAKKGEQPASQGGKTEAPTSPAKQETAPQKAEEPKTAQPGEQAGTSSESSAKPSGEQAPAKTTGAEAKEPSGTPESGAQAAPAGAQPDVQCPHQQSSTQQKAENPIASEQSVGQDKTHNPVGKPGNQSKAVPSFCQVDANKDHYITKDELQNFPDLLKVFDKVDAGKDGRLEQHEFQNLEMETKREGEAM